MRNSRSRLETGLRAGTAPLALLIFLAAPALAGSVTETDIVSDGVVSATTTDKSFVNPWGASFDPGGAFWTSANGSGTSPVYDANGTEQFWVTVPLPASRTTGTSKPSGQVYNPTQGFAVTQNSVSAPAQFIFVTNDGTISGWAPTVNQSAGGLALDNSAASANYMGATLFTHRTGSCLLAANAASGLVEVDDSNWTLVGALRNHALPANLVPTNVQALGTALYVTYAPSSAGSLTALTASSAATPAPPPPPGW